MNLILFDDRTWDDLLPLTFTRPVSALRCGILSIADKWEIMGKQSVSFLTRPHLQKRYQADIKQDNLLINSMILPDEELVAYFLNLKKGESVSQNGRLLAARVNAEQVPDFDPDTWMAGAKTFNGEILTIERPWKIFSLNGEAITADFNLLTKGRKSSTLSSTVNIVGHENIFVEEGFKGEYFTLNASSGPVYLGKDSEIMEGSVIRGPFALCEHSTVKLASKIYGPTTIGPHSKVGGEVNNSVLQAYSNKGHDGFLGNSVIGEWCNLGADTNNSNLKNNYTEVKLWSYSDNRFIKTGLQFCGLIMGDHSKCGINTMFNTGTVVGVSANIFGSGFPRNFIPSFSWGGAQGMSVYKLEKALETAEIVMQRRDINLDKNDRDILQWVYDETEKYRRI